MRETIARFFLRDARGQGLISRVTDPIKDILDGTVYMLALKGLFGITISIGLLILIVISRKVLNQVFAYLDERWGFWKAENWYESYMLNPYNREVLTLLKQIDKRLR